MNRAKPLLLLLLLVFGAPLRAADATYRLVDAFPGVTFSRPVVATQPPDGTPRMFVVEQGGRVVIVDHPAPAPPAVGNRRTFLDLTSKVSRAGNEEGLLGFAFHPGYATNGRFFVYYSAKHAANGAMKQVVAELRVSASDPDAADPASERKLLEVADPYENHNGGWIAFGPGGKLHIAMGDGGSGGDPLGSGQDLGSLLGKILRIDVDGAQPYAVPADNPFISRNGARPEVWAYGLRNPWRCSFDRATGDLWAADVGQDRFEEVDRIVKGGNYGWKRKEAFADYAAGGGAPADPLIDPLASYDHGAGESVTGGFVYRGANIPSLAGAYLYADFVSGTMWALRTKPGVIGPPQTKDDVTVEVLLDTGQQVASFGEDRDGELYVCSFSGRVLALKADELPPPQGPLPATLSELAIFSDLPGLVPADGALPYSVRSALWSDGAAKDRFILLPPGTSMTYAPEDAFAVPAGTIAAKTFTLRGRRLETRVILRTDAGFEAATYRWRSDLTDATYVSQRTPVAVSGMNGAQTWTYPSPADCRACHTDVAGFLLGLTSRQVTAVRGKSDLLVRWSQDGVLAGAVPPTKERPVHLPVKGTGRREARVRSYLESNCSFCHRPGTPLDGGALDLRAATPLDATGVLDAPQHGELGIAGAQVVARGRPSLSVLLRRMALRGPQQMPSIASAIPDAAAIALVRKWIRGLR